MGTLAHALRAHISRYEPILYRDDPPHAYVSPLLTLITWMFYLPIETRKFIIDCCRVQQPILLNMSLSRYYYSHQGDHFFNHDKPDTISFAVLCQYIDTVICFPLLASMLSYFARAESFFDKEQANKEKKASIIKEMTAAFTFQGPLAKLNYSCLYVKGAKEPVHPNGAIPSTSAFLWHRGISRIKAHYSKDSTSPLFPYRNDTKNVGYQTQQDYYHCCGEEYGPKDVTTLDLLKLYARTGIRIQGPLEVRQWWKYNDLRPRTYYALGGSAYWQALYIKEIANEVAKIFPSTHPYSRFDVTRSGNISPNEILVTYDYSSFTTSLGELKHFLFWLGTSLMDCSAYVVDVRSGLISLDLGSMILDYNDSINVLQEVDLQRILPQTNENTVCHQTNSGSLGTQGNIVFSMCNHGISLGGITDNPLHDSCVGDDALAKILKTSLEMMMLCVNNLGVVAPEKFSTIPRPPLDYPTDSTYHAFKYLKRPLYVSFDGEIHAGVLDFFPSFAEALFPEGDGVHVGRPDKSRMDRARTFVMQWGKFLIAISKIPDATYLFDEYLVLSTAQLVYDEFGLAFSGQIPGDTMVGDRGLEALDLWVPPCDNESVFVEDWIGTLCWKFRGRITQFQSSVAGRVSAPTATVKGDQFQVTMNPMISLMRDMDWLEVSPVMYQEVIGDVTEERLRRKIFSENCEMELLYDVVVLHVPDWYTDLASYYHEAHIPVDSNEEESEVTSVFGTSLY